MKLLIELIEELDLIDDNNWGEWSCHYSLDNGKTWEDGAVQSDGHLIAEETLVNEVGDKVNK